MGRMRAVSRAGTSAPMMATPKTAAMPAAMTPGEALAVTEVSSWLAPPSGPPAPPGNPPPGSRQRRRAGRWPPRSCCCLN